MRIKPNMIKRMVKDSSVKANAICNNAAGTSINT